MIRDKLSRKFEYLRISITDKCNYRCSYCMPSDVFGSNHKFLKKDELLSYEEIIYIARELKHFGLRKIRLTGGEPMLRKNIQLLIGKLKNEAGIEEVHMTCNGSLLSKENIRELKRSGLDSITISLDSISKHIGKKLNPTHTDNKKVIDNIYHVLDHYGTLKLNSVIIKNINEQEIIPIVNQFKNDNVNIRFIEYMDVGESNNWDKDKVITSNQIKKIISQKYSIQQEPTIKSSTSEKWILNNYAATLGFISSISKPFCNDCNRGRLSADGKFYTCLFSTFGHDLSNHIRNQDREMLRLFFQNIWSSRIDQYSKLRSIANHPSNNASKIEMSYIGG
ncbi:MAG: GTP 3',8-cyclase MoaA [Gammaproteobacteria bacterium]|nr:GTP 3',8-cyclase MoaA [Gammaproteobacteria bacterium]